MSQFSSCYTLNEFKEAWNNPLIIHYADREKPWNNIHCPFSNLWWSVCKQTEMWEYFYNRVQDEIFYNCFYKRDNGEDKNVWLHNIWHVVNAAKHLLVYGAGNISKRIVQTLKYSNIKIDNIVVTDVKNNVASVDDIDVIGVHEIMKYPKSAVIIIATQEKFYLEIINKLHGLGYFRIITLLDEQL